MKEIELKEQTLSLDKSINSMIYEVRGERVMLNFNLPNFTDMKQKDLTNKLNEI